jgi:hypothetical protein
MRALAVSLIGIAVLCAAPAVAGDPALRTVSSSSRHVVVAFSPGELTPAEIEVATTRARTAGGGFVASRLRLRERITARVNPTVGLVRYRTVGTVAPGAYFVAVSGFMQDPPADCVPIRARCAERWSNALPLVVR